MLKKKFKTGLVVGKFLPPHRGHKFLIDTATKQAEQVTVLVCQRDSYSIPADVRAAWIKEIHPTVKTVIIQDTLDDDDSRGWAANTIKVLGQAPEAVFTSEEYGPRYAMFMGSQHISIDRQRVHVPASGTLLRRHPLIYWEYLEPPVRAHFALRVCILGAESTGTTTLAKGLAEHYRTNWVPEYGREYSEKKMRGTNARLWTTPEFVHIAEEQGRREDAAARDANRVLICDTDPFATTIWHERYMSHRSPEVEVVAQPRRYAHYILTGDEIPFVQDGLRDGKHIRHAMHQRFIQRLTEERKPFTIVSGSPTKRLAAAINIIDQLLHA